MGHPPLIGIAPPTNLVQLAILIAQRSPCAKSKRGVVAYSIEPDNNTSVALHGTGYNGPPGMLGCDGSDACRSSCPKRCVHAEMRALWQAAPAFAPHISLVKRLDIHLIHVELSGHEAAPIVACDGPRCWQCSRHMVEIGCAGIWLYEAMMIGNALAITNPTPDTVAPVGRWHYYEADDFHRVTSERCEVHHGGIGA